MAAREANVSRATIRSWRSRAAGEGLSASAVSSGVAVSVPAVSPVAADGDELAEAERELVESREARRESLERSRALQRLGNDAAAGHAARAARDHAQAARALGGEVAILREVNPRVEAAQAQLMAGVVEGFLRALGIPWSKPFRALLRGLVLGRDGSEDGPDIGPLAERAASELRECFLRGVEVASVPRAPDDGDVPEGVEEVRHVGRISTVADDAGEPDPDPDDDGPLELVAMGEVPAAFRNRFAVDEAGAERARAAWSEKSRDQRRERERAEAEAEAARVSPPSAVTAGPLPHGWGGSGRRRGRGPSDRAGD